MSDIFPNSVTPASAPVLLAARGWSAELRAGEISNDCRGGGFHTGVGEYVAEAFATWTAKALNKCLLRA